MRTDAELVQKFEQAGVPLIEAGDLVLCPLFRFRESNQAPLPELCRRLGEYIVSVRTCGTFPEFLDEFGFELGGDNVLESFRFRMDLVPLHAENLGKHSLHEIVTKRGTVGDLPSFARETKRACSRIFDEAVFPKFPNRLGNGRRRNIEPMRQQGWDNRMPFAFGFDDRLQIIFTRHTQFGLHGAKLTMVWEPVETDQLIHVWISTDTVSLVTEKPRQSRGFFYNL